jgi:CO/xanthine dehydrogenase FAD-binding subunit
MRSNLPAYELVAPPSLEEAMALLAGGEWLPLAGGTDLMVLAEAGKLPHRRWVSLWHFDALRGITVDDQAVTLGALTTYRQVQRHPLLAAEYPLLCRAAAQTGGVAIQSRGTLGGNLANASPAADSPPPLLVYDAELELLSTRGARRIAYAGFHRGYKQTALAPGEVIAAIRLPRRQSWRQAGWREAFRKVGTRKAQAISKVCFAGALRLDGDGRVEDARLAFGSVAPIPLRCRRAEATLRGARPGAELLRAAQEALAGELAPIDDFRSTADYRRRVAQNLLGELLAAAPEGT